MARWLRSGRAWLVLLAVGMLVPAVAQDPRGQAVRRYWYRGKLVNEHVMPPSPPQKLMPPARIPLGAQATTVKLLNTVPALSWCFGCGPTAAAMLFGYYDNVGYPNMYAGPSNGGVFPMSNAPWGTVVIGGHEENYCPLAASAEGLDGHVGRGHVDNHWYAQLSTQPDPWITNGWPLHPPDCTADFMGSSRSDWGTSDGSTLFSYNADGTPLEDRPDLSDPTRRDGCHGLRLFAESRGYSILRNFSQYIYPMGANTMGFSYDDYRAEINAGRPVIIHVNGHIMLGVGYNMNNWSVYLRDTWDHENHEMTWGGSYNGMDHFGVTVLRLAPGLNRPPTKPATCSLSPLPATPGQNLRATAEGSVDPENVDLMYRYQWSRSTDGGQTWGPWGWPVASLPKANLWPGDWWKARGRAYDGVYYSGWRESAPVVISSMMASHVPASGATLTNTRGLVTIVFAAPVVQSSAQSRFTLTQGGTLVPGSFTWLRAFVTLRFTPAAPLVPGYDYDVNLAKGIRRRDGTTINWAETFSFVVSPAAAMPLTLTALAAPAATGAQVTVALSAPAAVQCSVLNLAGREVAVLPATQLGAGTHALTWNGRGSTGTRIPPGSYLVQVTARDSAGAQARSLTPLALR